MLVVPADTHVHLPVDGAAAHTHSIQRTAQHSTLDTVQYVAHWPQHTLARALMPHPEGGAQASIEFNRQAEGLPAATPRQRARYRRRRRPWRPIDDAAYSV